MATKDVAADAAGLKRIATVDFHGTPVLVRRGSTPGETLVVMRPMVEAMGLDWSAQYRKISRNQVLATCVAIMAMQVPGDNQMRETILLPLSRLNFWLATIEPGKVADPATRAKIIDYQKECADVLFDHFFGRAAEPEALTAKQTGGIIKAVVNRALEEQRQAIVADVMETIRQNGFPSGRYTTSTEYEPALAVVDDAGIPQRGRKGLVLRTSNALMRWCQREGEVVRLEAYSNRRLFHVDAVAHWMGVEGKAMMRAHLDRLVGQGVMRFGRPLKAV